MKQPFQEQMSYFKVEKVILKVTQYFWSQLGDVVVEQVSISPTFYTQLLHSYIPKV